MGVEEIVSLWLRPEDDAKELRDPFSEERRVEVGVPSDVTWSRDE